jgi:hypothetical protein
MANDREHEIRALRRELDSLVQRLSRLSDRLDRLETETTDETAARQAPRTEHARVEPRRREATPAATNFALSVGFAAGYFLPLALSDPLARDNAWTPRTSLWLRSAFLRGALPVRPRGPTRVDAALVGRRAVRCLPGGLRHGLGARDRLRVVEQYLPLAWGLAGFPLFRIALATDRRAHRYAGLTVLTLALVRLAGIILVADSDILLEVFAACTRPLGASLTTVDRAGSSRSAGNHSSHVLICELVAALPRRAD